MCQKVYVSKDQKFAMSFIIPLTPPLMLTALTTIQIMFGNCFVVLIFVFLKTFVFKILTKKKIFFCLENMFGNLCEKWLSKIEKNKIK